MDKQQKTVEKGPHLSVFYLESQSELTFADTLT